MLLKVLICTSIAMGASCSLQAQETIPSIPYRGIVEGFYGTPWSHQDRLAMMDFLKQQDMNMYIYAPKDDPFHREKWREAYPLDKQQALHDLIRAAERNQVAFVFAISPGLDMRFGGDKGKADIETLLHKFSLLYQMGVRNFAIFFDDIKNKDGVKQANALNEINRQYKEKFPGVKPLIVVPTQYNIELSMYKKGRLQKYTKQFSQLLDKDIIVMFTGRKVVGEGISAADMQIAEKLYGPRMAVWWNYPVNDYELQKLALGPVHGLEVAAAPFMKALVFNPMEHAKLSEISLATGAAYAKSPSTYDEDAAWTTAIDQQYGLLAKDMKVFASHSQRMGDNTHWARAGRMDAPEVRQHMDEFWKKAGTNEGSQKERVLLQRDFQTMQEASIHLQQNLPENEKSQCVDQLKLLDQLAEADLMVLSMVEAKENGRDAYTSFLYRRLISRQAKLPSPKKVTISERTAEVFLDEGIQWYNEVK